MQDPITLIRGICRVTDKCFVYTHYYNEERGNAGGVRTRRRVNVSGVEADYYEMAYQQEAQLGAGFWGGNAETRAWMTLYHILACFKHFGLTDITLLRDNPLVQVGAWASFAARRV